MLDVDEVWKSYRGVSAVRGLTLHAAPGDVVGLLGPNGSGKSTTVRMIVGLLRPNRGRIRWRGVDIQQQLLAYQTIVGYIPEEPRLYAYLSASLLSARRSLDRSNRNAPSSARKTAQ